MDDVEGVSCYDESVAPVAAHVVRRLGGGGRGGRAAGGGPARTRTARIARIARTGMTVLDPPRLLTRPVLVLAAGVAVNRMGSFVQVLLVVFLTSAGHPAGRAGLALTAYGAGAVAGCCSGGAATDRFRPRPAIIGWACTGRSSR
ncbi:hypothetical protein [Actinomadura gamaensis]|uniref:MFS transporter n=1 Tax=Actinomadura gamaensis TaxID=1763541 RepID=A0ABV9U8F9_9ACTN